MPKRATRTSFQKGKSGNPRGPKPALVKATGIQAAIRASHGDGSGIVRFLSAVMAGGAEDVVIKGAVTLRDQVRAAEVLLDYGYQRPPIAKPESDDESTESVSVVVQVLGEKKAEEKS